MEAHIGLPRYPWRLSEGTLMRTFGDSAWWQMLKNRDKKIVRLPTVIGNYYNHPSDQAYFRQLPHDESDLMSEVGVSLL
jgi:hypothetical protein